MAGRKSKRTVAARVAAVEEKIVQAERHALNRMHYWAGVIFLMLAGVMALHGVGDILYLGTALGGMLACIFE